MIQPWMVWCWVAAGVILALILWADWLDRRKLDERFRKIERQLDLIWLVIRGDDDDSEF